MFLGHVWTNFGAKRWCPVQWPAPKPRNQPMAEDLLSIEFRNESKRVTEGGATVFTIISGDCKGDTNQFER